MVGSSVPAEVIPARSSASASQRHRGQVEQAGPRRDGRRGRVVAEQYAAEVVRQADVPQPTATASLSPELVAQPRHLGRPVQRVHPGPGPLVEHLPVGGLPDRDVLRPGVQPGQDGSCRLAVGTYREYGVPLGRRGHSRHAVERPRTGQLVEAADQPGEVARRVELAAAAVVLLRLDLPPRAGVRHRVEFVVVDQGTHRRGAEVEPQRRHPARSPLRAVRNDVAHRSTSCSTRCRRIERILRVASRGSIRTASSIVRFRPSTSYGFTSRACRNSSAAPANSERTRTPVWS